jgi:hypothetical protein
MCGFTDILEKQKLSVCSKYWINSAKVLFNLVKETVKKLYTGFFLLKPKRVYLPLFYPARNLKTNLMLSSTSFTNAGGQQETCWQHSTGLIFTQAQVIKIQDLCTVMFPN